MDLDIPEELLLLKRTVREFVEDYWDMLEVKRRARSRAKSIPWTEVKKQLGLDRLLEVPGGRLAHDCPRSR